MNKALLSSKNLCWCTPDDFFQKLDREFNFTLDPAATPRSAKCKKYYTPTENGLKMSWEGDIVFCNPPYGRTIGEWVRKGYLEGQKPGTTVVMLIPSRTDTQYWHNYILNDRADEVRFIKGRLKFTDEEGQTADPAPFPSAIVIWKTPPAASKSTVYKTM